MKIIKLFKHHIGALVLILCLLIIQANAELALPSYMSDIVDVGIQQGGISSPVPDCIREQSLSDLEMFMSSDDADWVDGFYAPTDNQGVRAYQGTPEQAASSSDLAHKLALPETIALSLNQGVDASTILGETAPDMKLDMSFVRQAFATGTITRNQLVDASDTIAESMGLMSGSMGKQRAIQYVQYEYATQGRDTDKIRSDYLGSMAATMFAFCLVGLVATVLTGAVASRTAATIARDLRRDTYAKVMQFSPAEVNKFSQASLITRCTNDIQQIQMATTLLMRMVLYAPIMGAVAVMRVLATSTGLEWTIGIAVLAVCIIVGVLMGLTMPKFKRMQKLIDRVNLVAREMLDGLMPIRAFGRQDYELESFNTVSHDLMRTQLFTNRAMSFMMPLMMLVMNCMTIIIVWFGAHGVSNGVMQVGDMMAFLSYTMQIVMAFMILTMVSVMLPRAEVAVERVDEVRTCPLSITDPAEPQLPASDAPTGEVVFDHVSFAYPDAHENVISDVSFTTHKGKMTAFIGSTGSGKSTLVQLIPRLYDATQGCVLLDGVEVKSWPLDELRRRIGYIPQEGRLFSGTIESNLKFSGDEVTDDAMRSAAHIAKADEFIENRDGGYESEISQGGSNVSGGQRQRLAIARALAKNPEVIVFDDSFSALDYKTDAQLRENLATQVTGAALIVVGQRIATIMHADEIIVLNEGQVAGHGTHVQLLRNCPEYLEIAQSQMSAHELGMTEEEIAQLLQKGTATVSNLPNTRETSDMPAKGDER